MAGADRRIELAGMKTDAPIAIEPGLPEGVNSSTALAESFELLLTVRE
jgi:hypothetical protein